MRGITEPQRKQSARTKSNALWLLAYARPFQSWLWRCVGAGLVVGLATIVQLGLMAWLVHSIVVRGTLVGVELAFIGLPAMVLLRALFQWWQDVSGALAAREIKNHFRSVLLAQWAHQGPVELAGESSAVLAEEWLEQVEALEGYFARYRPQLWLAVLVPLTVLSVVFLLDWLAALFLMLAAPLIPVFMALIGMGAERLNQQHFESASRLAGHFLDRVRGLTTLQLLGQSRAAVASVSGATNDYRRLNMRTLRVAFLSSAALEFFASIAIAMVAIYVGFGLLGYIEFGPASQLTLFSGLFILLLAPEFFQPLRSLAQHYHDRAAALGAAEHLRARLQASGEATQVRPPPPQIEADAVVVRNLSVTYPGRSYAVKNLSFHLPEGKSLALVGPSGSGKSTLLSALANFVSSQGSLSLFGHRPGSIPVAWMNQRPFLIQGTWADNLKLVTPQASNDDMHRALKYVGLDQVLAQQPHGLQSYIGENGTGLSGGQGHRLALARIYLTPVRLILLDEPTAGLDPDTRTEVISALKALSHQGVTLIIATHQPELVAMADQVLEMPSGVLLRG